MELGPLVDLLISPLVDLLISTAPLAYGAAELEEVSQEHTQ